MCIDDKDLFSAYENVFSILISLMHLSMAAVCDGPFLNVWSHDTHVSFIIWSSYTPQTSANVFILLGSKKSRQLFGLHFVAGYSSQKAPPLQLIQLTAYVSLNQDVLSVRKSFPEVV